jgi:hypothetical protein
MKMEELADELGARRDEITRRAEDTREELARRAEAIREQFEERVTQEAVTSFAGWTLVSAGVAWGVTDWVRGRRTIRSLILPVVLVAAGAATLAGGLAWHRRSIRIDETEARVREELASLDPFARFRILRDVSAEQVPFVQRLAAHN